MKRAKILVLEGTDGSGKDTQSRRLQENLLEKGLKVKKFSFPVYDSATGRIVGGPYLGRTNMCESYFNESSSHVDPLVSVLYYAADRRYNFLNEIEDEIYKNDVIILDRYTTSNMGHQVGKAKNQEEFDKILKFIEVLEFDLCELPKPDLVVFLHMPYEASVELRKDRTAVDGNEVDAIHLQNAEKTYLKLCEKYNWHYINCIKTNNYEGLASIKTIEDISYEVIDAVNDKLKEESVDIEKMTRF